MTISLLGGLPVSPNSATPVANTAESGTSGQNSSAVTDTFGPAYKIDLSPEAKAAMAAAPAAGAGAATPKGASEGLAAAVDGNFGDRLVNQLRQENNGQASRAMRGKI
jgi:hypothetical protein